MKFHIKAYILLLTTCILASCGGSLKVSIENFSEPLYTPKHATGFKILGDEGQNTLISISQMRQGGSASKQVFAKFKDKESAQGFTEQYIVGDAKRVVCMSTSHIAMLDALGLVDRVVAVSGKRFVTNPAIVNNPKVRDIGYDTNLNYEALVALKPDVVFLYSVAAGDTDAITAKLRELGIAYIHLGDYTEQSPLGKAEWMVAVAEIMGCRERGEALYEDIVTRYEAVRSSVEIAEHRPRVMFNTPYEDVWYMPADDSYMVRLVEDAGGEYIYKGGNTTGGSRGISLERALLLVTDADIWLNVGQCNSLADLHRVAPHFCDTEVVRHGRVYNNNRRQGSSGGSDFWESAIVRPDVVLEDLVRIIAGEDDGLYYYKRL